MTDNPKNLEQLLPFYANGTLEGQEKIDVEKRLEEDDDFRMELKYLEALHNQIQQETVSNSPGELGLARLNAALDQENSAEILQKPANDNIIWRIAAIAAVVALVLSISVQVYGPLTKTDDYVTASGSSAQISQSVLQVFFNDATPAGQIRELLSEEKLTIIEGPTELGFYRLAPRNVLSDEELSALIIRLAALDAVEEALKE